MDLTANWLWQGGVIAVLTLATARLLVNSRAQARYLVYWAALAAVLMLPLVSLAAGFASSPTAAADARLGTVQFPAPDAWWTSNATVASLWALWIAVHAARFAAAALALRRARRRCRPFPPALAARLVHWNRVDERARRSTLSVSDDVRAAAVLGCGSPVIAVAPALLQHLTAEELDRVVIHEWAHVQRRDDVADVVQMAVRGIAGWHPAVWWLDRRLRVERELACDEIAVSVTASAKSYAACLVKLAGLPLARVGTLPALGALSRRGLVARVRRIVGQTRFASAAWSRNVATAAVVALAAVSLSIGALRLVEKAVIVPNDRPSDPGSRDIVRQQPVDSVAPTQTVRVEVSSDAATRRPAVPRVESRRASGAHIAAPPAGMLAAPEPIDSTPDLQSAAFEDSQAPGTPSGSDVVASPPAAEMSQAADAQAETRPATAADPAPPIAQPASPWDVMAGAGVAVGKGSRKASLATAGFFGRLSKRIAGAF